MATKTMTYVGAQLADSIQNRQAGGGFGDNIAWTTTDSTDINIGGVYSNPDSDSKTVENLNQLVKIKDEEIEKLELKIKELEEKLEDAIGHKYTNDRMERILE
jgi:hypothetical protein